MNRLIAGIPEKEWRKQWYGKYYAANRDKIVKRQREYYARNRERNLERRREYVSRNAEKVAQSFKNWYEKNKVSVAGKQRERVMRNKYSLSLSDIGKLLASQGGGCAICSADAPGGRGTWRVDHEHTTGRVRGLLCNGCNIGLGHMKDDPARLRKAADYIEKRRA